MLSSIPEGACACGAEGHMASIGPLALGAKGCVERLHRFAQGAADWRSGSRWSILSVLCPVHPFPLRGTSPQGETRDMREKTGSHTLHVPFRSFPLWWLAPPPFPRSSVGQIKGKRLNGQARRLTLPDLHILCRMCTVALWMLSHGAMSLQESIERPILPPA